MLSIGFVTVILSFYEQRRRPGFVTRDQIKKGFFDSWPATAPDQQWRACKFVNVSLRDVCGGSQTVPRRLAVGMKTNPRQP